MIFQGEIAGLPLDWIIFSIVGFIVVMIVVVMLMIFRGKDQAPVQEDTALILPEDQHGTLQTGTWVGNVTRTESMLIVPNPEWMDDDGNEYSAEIDIEKKIPALFLDASTRTLRRLWLVLDRGHLEVVSFTSLLHGFPRRWDPPVADRSKAGRFLVGRYSGSSIGSVLGSKMGLLLIVGLILVGIMVGFFLVTVSGHLH